MSQVTRLAFNLFGGINYKVFALDDEFDDFEIGECDPMFAVDNIFCTNLASYFFEAIKIRFPEYLGS